MKRAYRHPRKRTRALPRSAERFGLTLLLAVGLFGYVAWTEGGTSSAVETVQTVPAGEALTCTAPGITDGDTLRCNGVRVRLWGIDAPERDTPAGPPATRALAQIIDGGTITCERKDTDRYGRTVALCRIDGRDIAAEMVAQGHAQDFPRYSGGYYADR